MTVLDFGATERARRGADAPNLHQLMVVRWVAYGVAAFVFLLQIVGFFMHRNLSDSDEHFARLFGLGGIIVGGLFGQIIALSRRVAVLERQRSSDPDGTVADR